MGLFDHILAGKKLPEPAVENHAATPRRFRPIDSIQPRAVELPPPVSPETLPFPNGEIALPLAGLLDRVPAHMVRPGFVAGEQPVIYLISELWTQILEGRVRISLLSLSRKCPALFRSPIAPVDDFELPLSLELVVTQLPTFPLEASKPVETPKAVEEQVALIEPSPAPHLAPQAVEPIIEVDPRETPNAPQVLGPDTGLVEFTLPALPNGLPSPFDQQALQRIFQRREIFDALSVVHCIRVDGPARAVLLLIEDEDFANGDVPEDLTPGFALHLRSSFEQAYGAPLTQTHTLTIPDGERFRTVWAHGEVVLVAVHEHLQPPERLARLAATVVESLAEQHRCP